MPEHTIPESLIDQIRSGRAVLVVGAGIGLPTWKQLLEAMTRELEARGRDGDDAAARDLGKLLHKGSLTRAVGFLARSLGEEACDRIVAEMWQAHDLPAVPRLLAELPFRHIWTTFPGDLIERGLSEHSPEGWPPPRVATYRDLGALSRQRRTLVKILGNVDSFVVAPGSVRRALARAVDLRDYARDCYVEGTLVFVGFRFGDPDLAALLDRVFGMFEPPRGTHYLVGAGLGPVTVDELMADHHVQVIAIGGRAPLADADDGDDAGDDTGEAAAAEPAEASAPSAGKKKGKHRKAKAARGPAADPDKATLEWLAALRDACREAGLSLSQSRPAPDDLDGWLALLADELPEARDAVDLIERRARDAGDHERLIELLLGRIDLEPAADVRAGLLVQLAASYQATGDAASALTALTTAWHVLPDGTEAVAAAEALAAASGDWAGLVAEAAELTSELTGAVAAIWFARLGRWYAEKLDRPDYAAASLRRALDLDPASGAAHAALADHLRAQQRWAELADALRAHLAVEPNDGHKVDLYLALGDLAESQLAQSARAIEAYQAAAELDDENGEALAALERLHRRSERWADLAKVLDRRAELAAATGDAGQAAAFRRELATLRAEKLGDLEGAIARYEAALAADPADREALRALEDLYDRTGRTDDYLRTLERFVDLATDVAGPAERLSALRTLAAALEDRPGAAERAIAAYLRVLELDASADDAYRGLARLYEATRQPYERVAILERHVAAARTPADRAALHATVAQAQEIELDDPHRAIESHRAVLAIDAAARPSLIALARLYQRIEAWERAIEVLVEHAGLLGEAAEAAPLLAEAGRIAEGPLADPALAERHLDQALARDPAHYPALALLATLHDRAGSARLALEAHERAEKAAPSRLDRVQHLVRAAELAAILGDEVRAVGLWERVLRVDPEHVTAGRHVADHLIAEQRWDDALPALEMLAQRATDDDRAERARRETQLGQAYDALHRTEKAIKHFRIAVDADPDNLDAAVGLAAALLAEAQAHDGVGVAGATVDASRWQEVDRRHRDVLARHGTGLADGQVADVWYRIGLAARALGDDAAAEDALKRALDREPLHAATLDAMVEVAGRRGDWAAVIEARRAQLERAPVALQLKLLEEIGDLERGKRKDASAAAGAYLQALELAPGSRVLLHKLLDAHTDQKQWRRAIDALDELAAGETSGERRARYIYAAAVIARDEIGDPELAVERFAAALDAQPDTPKAFEAIDRLLTEREDWKGLARAYRRMLKRVGDAAPADRLLELWTRLGDVCLDHLGDTEAAIAALEVAADLAPADLERREQLAELYLAAGEPRRADAVEELQALLVHSPDRVELYKALAGLYRAEGDLDKAWCVAQTLVFLGAASDEERVLFERYRPVRFAPPSRRLTEELWQKAVMHPREDRHVGAIFATTLGALAAPGAQPPEAFGLDLASRADLERDSRPAVRVARHAVSVLALDPAPMVWPVEGGEGLQVANTVVPVAGADRGRLVPSLLLGAPQLARSDERELAFELGKRLAYLRPERYVNVALPALPGLEGAFYGALRAAGTDVGGDDTRGAAQSLAGQLPAPVLEQVAALASKINGKLGNGLLTGWRSAADLTANRIGFILCNDLEVAARSIATETAAMSGLPVKDRLRDLLAYSVSETYFQVRRHLGLDVRDDASS